MTDLAVGQREFSVTINLRVRITRLNVVKRFRRSLAIAVLQVLSVRRLRIARNYILRKLAKIAIPIIQQEFERHCPVTTGRLRRSIIVRHKFTRNSIDFIVDTVFYAAPVNAFTGWMELAEDAAQRKITVHARAIIIQGLQLIL